MLSIGGGIAVMIFLLPFSIWPIRVKWGFPYLSSLPLIYPGAPLKINRAPGNIQGHLTALLFMMRDWYICMPMPISEAYCQYDLNNAVTLEVSFRNNNHFHNYKNAFQPKAIPWCCCYSMLVPWMLVGPRRAPVYQPFWRASSRPSPPGMPFWGCWQAVAWRASLQPGCQTHGLQTQIR